MSGFKGKVSDELFPYVILYSEKDVVLSIINISATWNKLASSARIVDGFFSVYATSQTILIWHEVRSWSLLFFFYLLLCHKDNQDEDSLMAVSGNILTGFVIFFCDSIIMNNSVQSLPICFARCSK